MPIIRSMTGSPWTRSIRPTATRVDGAPSGPLDVLPSPEIVVYVNGKPYLQPTGEFAGFYVSETSYQNRSLPAIDPTRYLDARHAQYIVLPGGLVPEAKLGDLAIVYDPATHAHADAIFGDIGPSNESGEAALATLQRLGMRAVDGKSSPGQCRDDLFFLVFPQTSAQLEAADGWPHAQATIDGLAEAEFAKWGGPARIEAILKQDPQGGSVPDDSANSALYDELAFFRGRPGVDRYEFELPARLGGAADGRLPCAPELVIACRTAISACMRTIEAAERGRAPATSAIDLDAHLVRLATAFHRFPVETVDEIGPTERELARISALRDRIRRLARS